MLLLLLMIIMMMAMMMMGNDDDAGAEAVHVEATSRSHHRQAEVREVDTHMAKTGR